jgi:SAM-dependent methyltransferase
MYKTGEETLAVMNLAKWYNLWVLSFFKGHLKGNILEIGAGIGNFSSLLAKYGKVTTIDIRKDYVKDLNGRLGKQASVGLGDIETGSYFFKDRKFDALVCLNVLEHIKNDQKALKNMFNLLKKNGHLILLVPAHKKLYSNFDKDLGHYRRYQVEEVKEKMKRAGFGEAKAKYFNWWAALGWFAFIKMPGVKRMPQDKVRIFDGLGRLFLWPEKVISPPFGLSVFAIAKRT